MKNLAHVFFIILFAFSCSVFAQTRHAFLKYNFVSFNSYSPNQSDYKPITVSGLLSTPRDSKNAPVVIIVHGSGGVDERGDLYTYHLNKAGIATLEIDMWAARNLDGGLSRPKHVRKTLPDVYGAIKYLHDRPAGAPKHIGLIGFSWGGVISMLMAQEDNSLTALVANYPVCWAYNNVPGYQFKKIEDGKHLMIISGKEDLYDGSDDCKNLLGNLSLDNQKQVQLLQLEGATHAFDLPRKDSKFYDPYAFRGKGGDVPIRYNHIATLTALNTSVQFFHQAFGLKD